MTSHKYTCWLLKFHLDSLVQLGNKKFLIFSVACMNCKTTSERAFEELFIQINREVKSVERGYNDWIRPEMINEYQCRGLVN